MPQPIFPNLASGVCAKYPLTRRRKYRTVVHSFVDGTEQRYNKGVPLAEFELVFNDVTTADKETVRNFFNGRRGNFDTTWTFILPDPEGGTDTLTVANCQFTDSSFSAVMTRPNLWTFSLHIRQTRSN